MPQTPKARSLVLYEGSGEGTPFGEMMIPETVATILNTFARSKRIASTVEGFPAIVREFDARLKALGR